MYLNFRTAYIDKQGNLVTNKKKIATNYLKKWFFIDLISVRESILCLIVS